MPIVPIINTQQSIRGAQIGGGTAIASAGRINPGMANNQAMSRAGRALADIGAKLTYARNLELLTTAERQTQQSFLQFNDSIDKRMGIPGDYERWQGEFTGHASDLKKQISKSLPHKVLPAFNDNFARQQSAAMAEIHSKRNSAQGSHAKATFIQTSHEQRQAYVNAPNQLARLEAETIYKNSLKGMVAGGWMPAEVAATNLKSFFDNTRKDYAEKAVLYGSEENLATLLADKKIKEVGKRQFQLPDDQINLLAEKAHKMQLTRWRDDVAVYKFTEQLEEQDRKERYRQRTNQLTVMLADGTLNREALDNALKKDGINSSIYLSMKDRLAKESDADEPLTYAKTLAAVYLGDEDMTSIFESGVDNKRLPGLVKIVDSLQDDRFKSQMREGSKLLESMIIQKVAAGSWGQDASVDRESYFKLETAISELSNKLQKGADFYPALREIIPRYTDPMRAEKLPVLRSGAKPTTSNDIAQQKDNVVFMFKEGAISKTEAEQQFLLLDQYSRAMANFPAGEKKNQKTDLSAQINAAAQGGK